MRMVIESPDPQSSRVVTTGPEAADHDHRYDPSWDPYAGDDPINETDPSGACTVWKCLKRAYNAAEDASNRFNRFYYHRLKPAAVQEAAPVTGAVLRNPVGGCIAIGAVCRCGDRRNCNSVGSRLRRRLHPATGPPESDDRRP